MLAPDGLLERDECFFVLKALCGTRKASKRWQQQYTRVCKRFGWRASAWTVGYATIKILRVCADVMDTTSWRKAAMNC